MKSLAKIERSLPSEDGEMPRKYYPSFGVNDKQMPEIKKWEVGKTYILKVKVKMISFSEYEDSKRSSVSGHFDILNYETENKKSLY